MGLLTILKNFLYQKILKRNTTKPSKISEPLQNKSIGVALESSSEEVDLSGTVFITAELEKIFDIINEFTEESQAIIYEKLEEMAKNPKLVAFIISQSFTKDKKDVYNMLFSYKGNPTLIYSTNENLLAQFIEDNTNIPKETIYINFKRLKDDESTTDK